MKKDIFIFGLVASAIGIAIWILIPLFIALTTPSVSTREAVYALGSVGFGMCIVGLPLMLYGLYKK